MNTFANVTGKTAGLEFDLSGKVEAFDSAEIKGFDGTVVIPQYYSSDNLDGTRSACKTTEFASSVFRGNKEIKTVVLPTYIKEIPDYAFEGCTNLETVLAYGVTKIGKNAFKGCTSLKKFSIDNLVTSMGDNAFEGVPEIAVMAGNENVANAAIYSGAKRITLDISIMEGSFDNKIVVIPNSTKYFALISDGKTYDNLSIESSADETFISNIKFVNNQDIPLKINSEKATLARTVVDQSPGYALVLANEETDLRLYGNIELSSCSDRTVISKNVSLSKANTEVFGKMTITGNYYVCGEIANQKMLNIISGEIIEIDEVKFNNLLKTFTVTFDPNGGSLDETEKSRVVYYDQKYGSLPVPKQKYYKFAGWYTEKDGGTLVTEDTKVEEVKDYTLYAHWELDSYTLYFDANGGTVNETNRVVTFGKEVGELPVPTKEHYVFAGWYLEDGTEVTKDKIYTSGEDFTLYAHWDAKEYHVTWKEETGKIISVERTESPNKGAITGVLENSDAIYYGDVLKVKYNTLEGWTIESKGKESISVTGDVTSDDIYMTVWSDWSEWTDSAVSPSDSVLVESKTQYRYSDKQTTTSTNASLSGWTQTGSSTSYGGWGAWSAWQTNSVGGTDTREVQTSTVYGYYYFRCPSCGAHMHGWPTCFTWAGGCGKNTLNESHGVMMWSTTTWNNAGLYEFHGTGKYATDNLGGGRWFKWNDNGTPRTGYRYRTRSKTITYSYYKWSDWSSWGDTVYSANNNRKVETRTVYRIKTRY